MRLVNRAENWEKIYEAFQQINFSAFDSVSVKQSLLDYLKLYHPEDFNDYIESGELVMIIELFAYVTELLAYRSDLNAHENFLMTAERKESVLRLAKFISYKASRNIPARGLVKITSISTTEQIFDSLGNNLSNLIILWNDPNNTNWKEQFILIMNRVMEQNFGTVLPSDRIQVQDIVFELYGLNNDALATETLKYNVSVSGSQYPMELVSAALTSDGPIEKRPEQKQKMNLLYLNDGLGDSSENTGFFFYTKQGDLQSTTTTFDGVTPNQTFDIQVNNVNDIDVWVNNIDPITGQVITGTDPRVGYRIGEWKAVDLANAQNILFNTNPETNKYEVETLDNDQFRLIFGDGQFSQIPSGTFQVWYRVSANADVVIPLNAIQNITSSITYKDSENTTQTFLFSFSLTSVIQNAAPSEDLDHIKRVAPSVYYTQDRMVNGRDWNEFPLQDNSILKLRSINRTFAGDSQYIAWHDPRQYYDNVKIFGDDLVVYFKTLSGQVNISNGNLPPEDGGTNLPRVNALINNYIQPLLSKESIYLKTLLVGIGPDFVRKEFNDDELTVLVSKLQGAITSKPTTFYSALVINNVTDYEWQFFDFGSPPPDIWFQITSNTDGSWVITYNGKSIIAHSDSIKFWITNNSDTVSDFDTLNPSIDTITVLKANIGAFDTMLSQNYKYGIISQDVIDSGPETGTPSIHDLLVLPIDSNSDGIPDDVSLNYLINPTGDFVFFNREVDDNQTPAVPTSEWIYMQGTSENQAAWLADYLLQQEDPVNYTARWKRESGKDNLNFLWMHHTPRYHLVDPATTNIIDSYVITRGYYANLKTWLTGLTDVVPTKPTAQDLRSSYNYLLNNKMISDTAILHSGNIKIIIGNKSSDELRATLKVVKSSSTSLTNNQIKTAIVNYVIEYFDIKYWEFGETFYATQLTSYIHSKLAVDINSIVIVPVNNNSIFGDLFQIYAKEDEIIQPSITVDDIEIIESLDPRTIRKTL